MKKAKKLLSLVLVLVMAMSLMNFASAAVEKIDDFTDVDAITEDYVEAIDILVKLAVLEGYPDGSFDPDRLVTREEAAKIMCYLAIGTKAAANIKPTASRFTDIEDNSWASGYIEYCAEKDIIKGIGNGLFGAGQNVTGAQMSAMLLRLIGWGSKSEYEGSQWEVNSVVDGQNRNILINDVDFSDGATREEVAFYAFNALTKTSLVTYNPQLDRYYEEGTTTQIAGTDTKWRTLGERTFELTWIEYVDEWGYREREWKIENYNNVSSVSAANTYRIDRTLAPGANGWTSTNGTKLSSLYYPKTGSAFISNVVQSNGGVKRAAQYYYNGTLIAIQSKAGDGTFGTLGTTYYRFVSPSTGENLTGDFTDNVSGYVTTVATADATMMSYIDAVTARRGVIVDLIDSPYDDFNTRFDGKADKVIIIEKTASMLTSNPVVSTSTGAVSLYGTINEFGNAAINQYYGTPTYAAGFLKYDTSLKMGDYILYVKDGKGVTHVEKAASIAGHLTNYASYTKTATVGGNDYQESGLHVDGITDAFTTIGNKHAARAGVNKAWNFDTFINVPTNWNRDMTAFLDDNGSAFALVLGTVVRPSYVIVTEVAQAPLSVVFNGINEEGKVITGTIAGVTTADGAYRALGSSSTAYDATWFTGLYDPLGLDATKTMIFEYTQNGDSYYLTQPQYYRSTTTVLDWIAAKNSYSIRSGYVQLDTNITDIMKRAGFVNSDATNGSLKAADQLETSFYADESTIFIYYSAATGVKVYTGYSKLPAFDTEPTAINAVTYTPWPSGSTTAKVVYMTGGTLTNTSTDLTMFIYLDRHNGRVYDDGSGLYVIADVLLADGTQDTVKVSKDIYDNDLYFLYGPNSEYNSKLVSVTYRGDVIVAVDIPDADDSLFGYGIDLLWDGIDSREFSYGFKELAQKDGFKITASTPVITFFPYTASAAPVEKTMADIGYVSQHDDALFFLVLNYYNPRTVDAIYIVHKTTANAPVINGLAGLYSGTGTNATIVTSETSVTYANNSTDADFTNTGSTGRTFKNGAAAYLNSLYLRTYMSNGVLNTLTTTAAGTLDHMWYVKDSGDNWVLVGNGSDAAMDSAVLATTDKWKDQGTNGTYVYKVVVEWTDNVTTSKTFGITFTAEVEINVVDNLT